MAKLILVADLLKASALVRVARLNTLLIGELLVLHILQFVYRLFYTCNGGGVGSAADVAHASLRSIAVRDIASLNEEEKPAGEVDEFGWIGRSLSTGASSNSGLIRAVH